MSNFSYIRFDTSLIFNDLLYISKMLEFKLTFAKYNNGMILPPLFCNKWFYYTTKLSTRTERTFVSILIWHTKITAMD